MGEVSEYDHDILTLISTAQKVKDMEKKASSIKSTHTNKINCDGRIGLPAFIGKTSTET